MLNESFLSIIVPQHVLHNFTSVHSNRVNCLNYLNSLDSHNSINKLIYHIFMITHNDAVVVRIGVGPG